MLKFPKLVVEVMRKKHCHSLSDLQPGLEAALGYLNADGKNMEYCALVRGQDLIPTCRETILMQEAQSESCSSEKAPAIQNEQLNYSDDGVDLTLIRWMLSLTPSERLQILQQNVQSLARLCNESAFT